MGPIEAFTSQFETIEKYHPAQGAAQLIAGAVLYKLSTSRIGCSEPKMLQTPLTVLYDTVSKKPDALAFKIPVVDPKTSEVVEWKGITYAEFASDVNRFAGYWDRTFEKDGIQKGAVVALCLSGFEYIDVVHLYSISRAGYITHVFSRLPALEIVKDLLQESETKALVRSVHFKEALASIEGGGIPVYDAVALLPDRGEYKDMPALPGTKNPDDILLIAHTSGSTSGRPKLVRCNYRWIDASVKKMLTIRNIARGHCMIQPRDSRNPYDLRELLDMVRRASVNALCLFTPLVVKLLHLARSEPEVLNLLKGLHGLAYAGAIFPRSEEEYVISVGLNVRGVFASTEIGAALATRGILNDPSGAYYINDTPGISYQFDPVSGEDRILELVVRSDSADCPREEFRSKEDGHFHTGDLWERVEGEGKKIGYLYRGRDDDWIKGEYALRCDTKAIEENVRRTSGDLIFECVAVGYGRPSPALLVEPALTHDSADQDLKQKIFDRIQPFNSLFREHERIVSPNLILLVSRNTLPRTETKGNVKRKAAEDMFKEMLDRVYVNGVTI
ncbi:hypothetical protein V5O48_009156 [Marasmius crinis-equi]|uniref:AMP-dependent synthetase/ligase domain-containing protein n=1 Tax=Marasmius crinis-equi TaxID=585013 RepID=A0ABR3FCL0_9AGAR